VQVFGLACLGDVVEHRHGAELASLVIGDRVPVDPQQPPPGRRLRYLLDAADLLPVQRA
jgi:hypothetical protein